MFRMVRDRVFTTTVKVFVPSLDGHDEESLRVAFRAMPAERHAQAEPGSEDSVREFLRDALVSVEDVVDEAGKALPYTAALRDELLELPFVVVALYGAYCRALAGLRVGN